MTKNNSNKPQYKKRYMVDIGHVFTEIVQCAIEDMKNNDLGIISMPEYIRDVLGQFAEIRTYQREHGLPLLTPSQINKMIKTGYPKVGV